MTTPANSNEQPGNPEPAIVKGRLMAVDWANGMARLDMPTGDSVVLRFSSFDIDMENKMRKLATCHVDVWGRRGAGVGDQNREYINVVNIEHAWLKTEPLKEPKEGPISDEELEEFIRVIDQGRSGLCGECRYREPVV